jgi:hypothetical protein
MVVGYCAAALFFFTGFIYVASGIADFISGPLYGIVLSLIFFGSAVCLSAIMQGYRRMEKWAAYLSLAYFVISVYYAIDMFLNEHTIADSNTWIIYVIVPAIILIIGFSYLKRMGAVTAKLQYRIGIASLVAIIIAQIILLIRPPLTSPLSTAIQYAQSTTTAAVPSSGARWQTYSHMADPNDSEDVSFSFEYPSGYVEQNYPHGGLPFIVLADPQNLAVSIQVSLYDDTTNLDSLIFSSPSSTVFAATGGLSGKEAAGSPPDILFGTSKKDSSGKTIFLDFSTVLPNNVLLLESIAKTTQISQ